MNGINNHVKVGAFVVLMSAIAGYLIVTFGGKDFGGKTKDYVVYFDDVEGLVKGADVQVKGVKAGQVKELQIDKKTGKVKVILAVKEDVPIYRDAKAYIKTLGLMGDKFVYIDPGHPSTGIKKEPNLGEGVKYATLNDTINNVNEAITKGDLKDLIVSIRLLAKHLDQMVQENRKNIKETTKNLKEITDSLRESIPRIAEKIDRVAANLEQITGENKRDIRLLVANLREFSESLKEKTPKILDDIDDTTLTVKDTAVSIKDTSDVIRDTVQENRPNIKDAIANIKDSAARLESILAKVDEGKGTIGKLVNEDTLYQEVREGVNAFSEPFKVVKRAKLNIKLYGEYHSGNEDSKAGIGGIFAYKPDRYIYLGLLSNSNGRITKTEEIISGDNVTTYNKKEYGMLFDVQYARKFWTFKNNSSLWIRGGLKDSTGDVGLDYQIDDYLVVKSDLYNFGRKYSTGDADRPQLDIYLNYKLPNYPFFVGIGGSDLLNDEYRGIYLGGGFIFSDNDLKYILGSMPRP